MTDLEITKACAEAMGYDVVQRTGRKEHGWWAFELCKHYQPLHDDAQAMALVKKFRLITEPDGECAECDYWAATLVNKSRAKGQRSVTARHAITLNQAICECVAKMWALNPSGARPRNGG